MNIGKYEVQVELGHGAMGTVYKARDPRLDRHVAIKLISRSATLDPKLFTMFEKEARAIARLSHPNIVTIFEFDYSDQQPYIVMELLNGSDMSDSARLQDLSIAKKLDIIRQVCEGLSHAHQQEIIHRDIKPANIFLTEAGAVKITDFGIARLSSGTMTTGSIMGTPEFMAPERLTTGKVDKRSDLFSTGVVMYWLLSGIRPFAADDFNAVFYKILNHEPPDLTLIGVTAAQLAEINRVLHKSLAKDPEQRYASATDMAQDLRALEQWIALGTQPVPSGDTQNIQAPDEIAKTIRKDAASIRTQPDPTLKSGSLGDAKPRRFHPALLVLIVALVAAGFFGVYKYVLNHKGDSNETMLSSTASGPAIRIGVATGKEKLRWMDSYGKKFSATPEGANIQVETIPIGSLDAFRAVVEGDRRIQVWAPASDMQEDFFLTEWKARYNTNPIVQVQNLALSPMVILVWENRYQEFIKKFKTVSFSTIAKALQEKNGWSGIANKPEWGRFKFGLSDPNRYNSGMVMLFILSHEYHRNPGELSLAQVQDKGLLQLMNVFRQYSVGMKMESNDLLEEMIAKGPSSYDMVFTYESIALRSLKEAEGRWGKARLVYPVYNFWMDNPYYVLSAPWITSQQQAAAKTFLQYLYSPRVQQELLAEGIRPANPEIPLLDPGSPFLTYKEEGIVIDIQNAMDEPKANIVKAMLDGWAQLSGNQSQL